MEQSTYMTRRGKRGIYQLRMTVPSALRRAIGMTEKFKSLGTSDFQDAIRRSRTILAMWEAEFDGARALIASLSVVPMQSEHGLQRQELEIPTNEELEEAAVTVGYDFELQEMDEGRRNLRNASSDFFDRNASLYRQLSKDRARHAATGNITEMEHMAEDAIEALGWHLPKGTDRYDHFCRLIGQANLAAFLVSNQRNDGIVEADTDDKLVQRVRQRKDAQAPSGMKLIDLFERYADQQLATKKKRIDTINQDRKVLEGFARFLGEGRGVSSITSDDVRDWIDTLELLPPNFRKMNAYKNLTLRAAAKKAMVDGNPGLSLTTLNKYLSTVSPFFKWLKKRNYHPGPNPCDGLFYDIRKGSNPRPPFRV